MPKPSITAKDLAVKVINWPVNCAPVSVSWEHDGLLSTIRLIKDHRGVLMLCRCDCAVRALYPHPMGRDALCIECYRRVADAFDLDDRRTAGRLSIRKTSRKGVTKPNIPTRASRSKSEIPTDKPAPGKKSYSGKKEKISPELPAARLQKNATAKKAGFAAPKKAQPLATRVTPCTATKRPKKTKENRTSDKVVPHKKGAAKRRQERKKAA